MTATTPASDLPRLTVLGDGTATVAGRRNEIRLSQDRTRWWNGVFWERSTESTPPGAIRNQSGAAWWDGEEWRPVARVRPTWEAPEVAAALHAVPFLLIVAALAAGGTGLWGLAVLAYAGWAVLVVRSNLIRGRSKGLWIVLSVAGLAIDLALTLRERQTRDTRVAESAARL